MQIRPATPADVEEIDALVISAKAYWKYSSEQLQVWRTSLRVSAESITARPAFIGEHDGAIVAFGSLVTSSETWELDNLWVLPRYARQGFGRVMLDHARQLASMNGARSIAIDADPNAEPFYLACGARRQGEVAAPIDGQPHRIRPQLVLDTGH